MNRNPRQQGPLNAEEVRTLIKEGFDQQSAKLWSEAWASADLSDALCETGKVRVMLEQVNDSERVVLSEFASVGGRARGDLVRRTLTLRGHEDASKAIRALALRGLLLPIPAPNSPALSIERFSQRSTFLQSDFALTSVIASEVVADERLGAEIDSRVDLESVNADQTKQFILNLLVLHATISRTPLQLTKLDIPNRRTLAPITQGLWIANPRHAGTFEPENLAHMDELAFSIGVLYGLDAVQLEHSIVTTKPFHVGTLDSESLGDAYARTELWVESDREGRIRHTTSSLPALRAYTRSVLRRIGTTDWISIKTLERYCRAVDSIFFNRAASQQDVAPSTFVSLWVESMAKVGAIELAYDSDVLFLRETSYALPDAQKSFVVQPSGEVSAFFDPMTAETAQTLFRMAEIEDRQERTLTLRISAESAQRGFVSGLSDDEAVDFLNEFGVTPLPNTTEFQLRDWYRVHRQHSIFVDGVLLRCRDFDALDMAVGQLKHDDPHAVVERLTGDTVFVSGATNPSLTRLWRDFEEVSQLASYGPCLEFRERFCADYDPFRAHVETEETLHQIGEIKGGVGFEKIRFDMDKVRALWPKEPYETLIAFLQSVTFGEIPAEQLVAFRHELVGAESIRIERNVVLLTVTDEMFADALERVEAMQDAIVSRVGPTVFEIDEARVPDVKKVLERLNIGVEDE